ncbi:hypothetical protein Tco_0664150 [Tanacetum coccineum]
MPEKEVSCGFADEVIYSPFCQTITGRTYFRRSEQIEDWIIERKKMDINWQISNESIIMKKFYKKTGRRVRMDGKTPVEEERLYFITSKKRKQEKKTDGLLLTMDEEYQFGGERILEAEETKLHLWQKAKQMSLSHLIKDCDYYKKKMAREAEDKRVVNTGNGVAKPVWTNANRDKHYTKFCSRTLQLNAGRPKFNSVRPNINTGRTNINSGRPKVNVMPDENQILLKVPRHHNMYSFDMKTPSPAKGFACLIAKATSDESKLWHRRIKPNVKGVGYRWMFDIDYLTDSMNYIPVSLENQANPHVGASEVTNSAGTPTSIASEEKDEEVELIVVPSAVKIPEEKDESRTSSTNSKKEETLTEPQKEKKDSSTDSLEDNPKIQAFRRELEEIALKHLGTVPENNTTSTPSVNTGSQTVNTGRLDHDDSLMPELEIFHKPETGIFDEASYDEEGVITDFNSLPTEIEVSPTPTLRIHSIHPKSQILGDPKSAVQTRSKVQNKSGAHALLSHIQKQQRNNHKDQQHCLFACFLSQEEPKKIAEALQDDRNKRDKEVWWVRNRSKIGWPKDTQEEVTTIMRFFAPVGKKRKHIRSSTKDYSGQSFYGLHNPRADSTDQSLGEIVWSLNEQQIQMSSMGELHFSSPTSQNRTRGIFISSRQIHDRGIHQLPLEAFSDSDYTIVATSTTEAEYVAAANCCGQILADLATAKTKAEWSLEINATIETIGYTSLRGFRGAPRPLLPAMLLVATNPNAGQEHDVVAPSQPSSSTPPVPSTSSPPVQSTPTPIPATIPHPHLPGNRSQTNQADNGECYCEVSQESEEVGRDFETETCGEEQVEDISPNTLEAAKTLSKVASLKPRSIDKGRRYKRRKEAKGKKVVSSLDFQEEVDTGAEQGQREGKAPMIMKKLLRSQKKQIYKEEASLA